MLPNKGTRTVIPATLLLKRLKWLSYVATGLVTLALLFVTVALSVEEKAQMQIMHWAILVCLMLVAITFGYSAAYREALMRQAEESEKISKKGNVSK